MSNVINLHDNQLTKLRAQLEDRDAKIIKLANDLVQAYQVIGTQRKHIEARDAQLEELITFIQGTTERIVQTTNRISDLNTRIEQTKES